MTGEQIMCTLKNCKNALTIPITQKEKREMKIRSTFLVTLQ